MGYVAGGHALGDQPAGAAEGGGEEEGEAGGEGEDGRTSEEQVSEGEGRGREGILLLFQRQVTKTSSGSLNRPEPVLVWDQLTMFTASDLIYLCRDEFTGSGLYIKL